MTDASTCYSRRARHRRHGLTRLRLAAVYAMTEFKGRLPKCRAEREAMKIWNFKLA